MKNYKYIIIPILVFAVIFFWIATNHIYIRYDVLDGPHGYKLVKSKKLAYFFKKHSKDDLVGNYSIIDGAGKDVIKIYSSSMRFDMVLLRENSIEIQTEKYTSRFEIER